MRIGSQNLLSVLSTMRVPSILGHSWFQNLNENSNTVLNKRFLKTRILEVLSYLMESTITSPTLHESRVHSEVVSRIKRSFSGTIPLPRRYIGMTRLLLYRVILPMVRYTTENSHRSHLLFHTSVAGRIKSSSDGLPVWMISQRH